MKTTLLAVAAVAALTACAPGAAEPPVSAEASLLVELGLDGLTGRELVEQLDTSEDPRPFAFGASVREDEVLISTETEEVSVPLPAEQFYVSIAPYVDQTHECYHHNVATCRGELAGEEVTVTFTDGDGEVLLEETTATYANGFVGFWLPRDVNGVIEVEAEAGTGSVPFSTSEGSPTCITTLQLDPAATA